MFSPSVNIVRDAAQPLNYLPTPNAQLVYKQLANNYRTGTHCFNIVGAYGTGKSAFLWAFHQNLTGQHAYFTADKDPLASRPVRFEQFVGQYMSLREAFAQRFVAGGAADTPTAAILAGIEAHYRAHAPGVLVLVIDEFGKFLEYAARENPEQELYFIQELAEFANDTTKDVLLLSTAHQDVSAYAVGLSRPQRLEWEKVKGRLKELTFNEPVEQLLALAAEQLAAAGQPTAPDPATNERLLAVIARAQVFPLRDYFTAEMQRRLWPLDLLSAAVLVQALQRYGQNERSLFTFLRAGDYLGLEQSAEAGTYYSVSRVYDYLSYHYYALLTSRFNPNFAQWAIIRDSLDRLSKHFETQVDLDAARQLVKTIGLLTIFAPAGAEISAEFLEVYAQTSLGVPSVAPALRVLQTQQIVRFVAHKNSYILFEGTALDIELAIDEAGTLVEQVTDVATRLSGFFDFPYIPAKQASFEVGTPRIFQVRMTDYVLLDEPEGEVDGFINLIFSDSITEDTLRQQVGERRSATLYGIYRRSGEIKRLIREIDKVAKVREQNLNDRVAKRELDGILEHQEALLRHYVLDSLYAPDGNITWFFNGEANTEFTGRRAFNRCLSAIAREVYTATPIYRSELVNRTNLSVPILTARKNYIRALFEKWQYAELDFPAKNYPPEKTIYLSLLRETGMHRVLGGEYTLTAPTDATFLPLWEASEAFLQRSQDGHLKVRELMDDLTAKPFKLKQGFVDFWVPTFLFMKRHEFALYGEQGRYIPDLTPDVVDLFTKNPSLYTIKAFSLLPEKLALFNEYRELLQLAPAEQMSNVSFIESIKPFLSFYKQLPAYAKKTSKLSATTQRLRETIATAKDPEAAFFEQFPGALGFNRLELQRDAAMRERYVSTLQDAIARLRQAYPTLLQRLEEFIAREVAATEPDFAQYKRQLQYRFRSLSPAQLPEGLRQFQQRLMSRLDDRDAWLNSMANALLSKSLTYFTDADETRFQEKFQQSVHELDNFCDPTTAAINPSTEEFYQVRVAQFGQPGMVRNIRAPKSARKQTQALEKELRQLLATNKEQSKRVLGTLLAENLMP
ncbi:hypothetical protein Q5H92_02515 [Hymenobacter sp. M29]|uniref:ATP-binding protein n=1 Tax=Hymenobacter mellowenesis TaxID=3063995 RepID=A0ABT9A5W2_9BACT|nr:hypothetical protein [Hymenobacter sp. M29]MDO7845213.1 hypothetical protein [Hymenobacter sp. M29]